MGYATDLHAAVLGGAGQLLLGRVALAERHRHELPDQSLGHAEAVEPRLVRRHQVVLGPRGQGVGKRFTGERVHLAGGDHDRHRIPARAAVYVDPERLGLIHRHEHAAVPAPAVREAIRAVIDMVQREGAQAGRQAILAIIVGNAQRALK